MAGNKLRIIHFDVSQGESSLISLLAGADSKHVLIDGGKKSRGRYVLRCLEKLEIERLDWIVCTHPDGDHHEGLEPIIKGIAADALIAPGKVSVEDKYQRLKAACKDRGVKWVNAGVGTKLIDSADCTLEIVHVGKGTHCDDNPASIGCRLQMNQFIYFTAGDLPFEQEEKLSLGHVCAFKCGHHGANTSTSEKFISQITPTAAFISAGRHNHDHPRQDVLDRLCKAASLQAFYATNCVSERSGFVGRSGSHVTPKGFVASARENGVLGHVVLYTDEEMSKNHDGSQVTFQVLYPMKASLVSSWHTHSFICKKKNHAPDEVLPPIILPLSTNELPIYQLEVLSETIKKKKKKKPTFSVANLIAESKKKSFKIPTSPIHEYMLDPANFTGVKRHKDNNAAVTPLAPYEHPDEDKRMAQCASCNKNSHSAGNIKNASNTVKCECNLEWYICKGCASTREHPFFECELW